MIAIIDYGAGNLFSVKNALNFLNIQNSITNRKEDLISADGLILPGVGAFPDAMKMLNASGLVDTIKSEIKHKPLLGICLGMQLLFEKGFEFEETEGLGLIQGTIRLINSKGLKIPHMGWNSLTVLNPNKLTSTISNGDYVYFVHSFMADTHDKYISAYSEYGEKVPALVCNGNVFGAQFHPEKSGDVGLKILKSFGELVQK